MARPRSSGFDEQRAAILRHAAALFAEQGYGGASMQSVAEASGVSKATLYHYVRSKHDLLALVALAHVQRLHGMCEHVLRLRLAPRGQLAMLIRRFVAEYAHASNEHRVLTENVHHLQEPARSQVLALQRQVVAAFAQLVGQVRPDLTGNPAGNATRNGTNEKPLHKPLTMLLFGMMNWLFTWYSPAGALGEEALGDLVADLFMGGLSQLQRPATTSA